MEILKYKNGLNNLEFGNMSPKEQDIFFSLLKHSNQYGVIEVPFSIIKKITKTKEDSNKRFENRLDSMSRKFLQATQKIEIEEGINIYFNVFDDIIVDKNKGILSTKIKNKFLKLLKFDEKDGEYTTIDLQEMCSLTSSYSKIMYRIIKQWETIGSKTIELIELKKIMEIPKSYQMGEIDRRILKPITKELKEIFNGFTIIKNKSSVGKGRKVESITFTWQKIERKKKNIIKKEEIQVLEDKKLFDKKLLKTKILEEEKEIENLKAKEKLIKMIEINLSDKIVERTIKKITVSEYKLMYQNYLKVNKIEATKYVQKCFDMMNKGKYEIILDEKKIYNKGH